MFSNKKRVVLPLRYFMSECDWTFVICCKEFKENYFVRLKVVGCVYVCVCACACARARAHTHTHTHNKQTCRKTSELTFLHKWGQNDMLAEWFDISRANSFKLPVIELCIGFMIAEWASVECWWKDTVGKIEVYTDLFTYLCTYAM
jgi:hypothetical protein